MGNETALALGQERTYYDYECGDPSDEVVADYVYEPISKEAAQFWERSRLATAEKGFLFASVRCYLRFPSGSAPRPSAMRVTMEVHAEDFRGSELPRDVMASLTHSLRKGVTAWTRQVVVGKMTDRFDFLWQPWRKALVENNKKEEAWLPYGKKSVDLNDLWNRAERAALAPPVGQPKPGYVPKTPVTLKLDHENLTWVKSKGPNYQTRINAVLGALREAETGAAQQPPPLSDFLGIDHENAAWLRSMKPGDRAWVNNVLTALRTASRSAVPDQPLPCVGSDVPPAAPPTMEP